MSDVERIYVPPTRPGSFRFRRFRRGGFRRKGGCFGSLLLGTLAVLLVWALWATRDSYSMHELIPDGQHYQVFVGGLLNKRESIAASPAWALAPRGSAIAELPELLRRNFGMPDWLLNNLVYDGCHVSGHDAARFDDVLFVTRMSRVGCLAEKFHRFVGVAGDFTGGLRLRFFAPANLYYAVRGRVLVASPSRNAVIRAVTLRREDALPQDVLAKGLEEAGGADVYGRFAFEETEAAGEVFADARVMLRFEETGMSAMLHGALRPPWRERLAGVLDKAEPAALRTPLGGSIEISGNFGIPIGELIRGGLRAADTTGRAEEIWSAWLAGEMNEDTRAIAQILGGALMMTGPGWRLSWRGMDLNEMLPAPELVATFDLPPEIDDEVLALLPEPPPDARPWAPYPRRDPDRDLVVIPLIGGPSLTPALSVYPGGLFISSSRTVADALLASGVTEPELAERANLFIRVRPRPLARSIVDTGQLLARNRLLRDFTEETFAEWSAAWLDKASRVDEAILQAAHDDGNVSIMVRIRMAVSSAQPATE